jgi:hypothetical protein
MRIQQGLRVSSGLSLLVLPTLFLACAAPTPDGPFRLSGAITDATSAAPLPGAVVEATHAGDESQTVRRTCAGPDGTYVLSNLGAVTYVRVRHDGYRVAFARVELTTDGARDFTLDRDPSAPTVPAPPC